MIKDVEMIILRSQVATTNVLLDARNRLSPRAKAARDFLYDVAHKQAMREVQKITIQRAIEKVEEKRSRLLSGK